MVKMVNTALVKKMLPNFFENKSSMKVLLDWDNPEVMEKVRLGQRQLREQIMKRWEEEGIEFNPNKSCNKKDVFGFHFG